MKQVNNESIAIYETHDYSLFKKLNGNRDIDKNHLEKIIKSMEKKYLPIPIIVNEKFEIIDGQHRIESCKKLKYPINYVVINGCRLDDVKLLNSNSKQWSLKDYLNAYCKTKNKTYIQVKKFINEYGFSIVDSLTMLSNTKSNQGIDQIKFKQGIYEIKDINKAREIAEKMLEVKPYFDRYKTRSFFLAMSELFHNKNYNHKKFIQKLSAYPTKLRCCSNKYDYLKNIEDIFNFNQKKKIRLF